MDTDVRDMWVKALESGEYRQTQSGGLRDRNDEFCCLGVLCDLAVREGVIGEPEPPSDVEGRDSRWYTYVTVDGDGEEERSTAFLPQAVMAWSGLATPNAEVSPDVADQLDSGSLTSLNDNGATFVDIADIVRDHF